MDFHQRGKWYLDPHCRGTGLEYGFSCGMERKCLQWRQQKNLAGPGSFQLVTGIFRHWHLIPPIPPGPFAEMMEEYRSPVTSWQLSLLNSLLPGLSSGIIKPCNIIT